MKTTIYLLLFVTILFNLSYGQNTYYFSSSEGNDTNNGLTSSSPKQTLALLQALLQSASPGDQFLLKRGDTWTTRAGISTPYSGVVGLDLKNVKGNSDSYITIGAYGSGTNPTFNFTGQGAAFQLEGCKYTIIRDLRVVATNSDITNRPKQAFHGIGSLNGGAHHVQFINLYIDGVAEGFRIQDASHDITLNSCDIRNTIGGTVLPNGTSYEATSGNGIFSTIANLTITHCTFVNNGKNNPNDRGLEHAIYLASAVNSIIEYCTMYTEPGWSSPCSPILAITNPQGGRASFNIIYNAEYVGVDIQARSDEICGDYIFEGNTIYNSYYVGVLFDIRGTTSSMENIIFRNNIIYSNGIGAGIWFENIYSMDNIQIVNNTIVNNYWAIGFVHNLGSITNLVIKNNIMYNDTYSSGSLLYVKFASYLSNADIDHNLYYSGVGTDLKVGGINLSLLEFKLANVTKEINSISGNPLFTNQLAFDFHISENSTAIDKGVTLTNVTDDFNGNLRPAGGGFDIGAYEYGSTQGSSNIRLNIKVLLEGPFSNGSMSAGLLSDGYLPLTQPYNDDPWNYNGTESVSSIPSGVIDWVLLELRSGTASSTVVSRKAAFFKSDGSIVDLDGISQVGFNSVSGGNYYIVILHRNHLPVMSANAVSLSVNSDLYDFTTSSSKAYGTDALADLGGGKWGLYAGDSDKNGTINVLDYGQVINFLFETGYKYGDLDLNGIINVLDYSKTNSNLFKSTQVPN